MGVFGHGVCKCVIVGGNVLGVRGGRLEQRAARVVEGTEKAARNVADNVADAAEWFGAERRIL